MEKIRKSPKNERREARNKEQSQKSVILAQNQLLAQLGLIIFKLDPKGKIKSISQPKPDILGYPPDSLTGKNFFRVFFPGKLYKQAEQLFAQFNKKKRLIQVQLTIQAKDGRAHNILWTSRNHYDKKGQLSEINCIIQSLMQEQVLNQGRMAQLSQSPRYRFVHDNIGIWIDILDSEGNVVYWNRAAEVISGYKAEEVLGHKKIWKWLYPNPKYRKEIFTKAMEIIRGERVENLETIILTKDGRKRSISWHSHNLTDADGKIIGSIAIGADVTEQRKIEEQARLIKKMDSLTMLVGNIVSKLNNNICAVAEYAELALSDMEYNHPAREHILEIDEIAHQCQQFTNKLLTFSKRIQIEPITLELNPLIQESELTLKRILGEETKLRLNLDKNIPKVKADPEQLQLLLIYLADNARANLRRKKGEKIFTITTALSKLDYSYIRANPLAKPGEYVLLVASDNGPGLKAEELEHIFEPKLTNQSAEINLGLSEVYGIITQHNGYIRVESEPNQGVSFQIYLSKSDEPVKKRMRKPLRLEIPTGRESILLVETDELARSLAVKILRKLGYTVFEARDTEEALMILKKYPGTIHLLLTNLALDKISGIELAQQAKKIIPSLKSLYISDLPLNYISDKTIISAKGKILLKPLSTRVLAQKIRKVLNQR